jgi:acyl-CoA synthetase (AMP-forming)/AMP-acid ligase II
MTAVAPATFALIEAELLAWCAERLSKAKRPHRVEIVDELPRTSVGRSAEPASLEASAGGVYAERAQT